MRIVPILVALVLVLLAPLPSRADEPPDKDASKKQVSSAEIDRLIQQLGDAKFTRRMQARKQLEDRLGPSEAADVRQNMETVLQQAIKVER